MSGSPERPIELIHSRTMIIKGTDIADIDVGLAIWSLAQFPKGSKWSNVRMSSGSEKQTSMFAWHEKTIGGAEDERLLLPPDICVTNITLFNQETGKNNPTDSYRIEVNPQYVDPSLLDKIEPAIREEDTKIYKV